MTVKITAAQRDALYEEIVIRLSGIDAVHRAAEQQDFARAQSLALEFSDALQIVMDDLGWGEATHVKDVELTTRPDVLRRVLDRLREAAAEQLEAAQKRAAEARELEDHYELVVSTCRGVLRELCTTEPSPS
jgi:hypothetical protein